jgi:non-homologous end joining protein Ku
MGDKAIALEAYFRLAQNVEAERQACESPVYYDAAYRVAPDGDARRDVFAVLREATAKTG